MRTRFTAFAAAHHAPHCIRAAAWQTSAFCQATSALEANRRYFSRAQTQQPSVRSGGRPQRAQRHSPRAQAAAGFPADAVDQQQQQAPSNLYYFATCHPGLEDAVMAELANPAVGVTNIRMGRSGVSFNGVDVGTGYRANLWLRSAIRVLQLLAVDQIDPEADPYQEIYRAARQAAPWEQLLPAGNTFKVQARANSCNFTSNLVCQGVRDGICDHMVDAGRPRPLKPEDTAAADLPLIVNCFQDRFLLYRNMSGDSLHRRGYRDAMHRASLNESAAAGILHMAGWPQTVAANPRATIADPMCGSGTFLIEAVLMARNVAPGLNRTYWPFQQWVDFDRRAWGEAVRSAKAATRPWEGRAVGCDVHEGALDLAWRDATAAGVTANLRLRAGNAAKWELSEVPDLTVVNPPWGQRLLDSGGMEQGEVSQDLVHAWQDLSVFLKGQCADSDVHVLDGSGDGARMTRQLRMKSDWHKNITIGGVDTRLLRYHVLPKLTAEQYVERGAKFERARRPRAQQ